MKALSPFALWYRISMATQVAMRRYQMDNYGLKLEIPPYPSDFVIAPVIVTTEQAAILMKQRPHHPKGVGYRP